MQQIRTLPLTLGFSFLVAVCASAGAQDASANLPKGQPVPQVSRPVPFPLDGRPPGSTPSIEFRSPDQMTAEDHTLMAAAEPTIREHAGIEAMDFDQGKWSYRQLVCAALPNHVFLRFMRDNGEGDVSVFSASIPRGNGLRVRLIPIERRGYSLFSPTPINALTIAVFNRIRAEEPSSGAQGWMATGLCYAALSGAQPLVAPEPILEVPKSGKPVIRFTDVAPKRPMEWTMTFNDKGRLLKATHVPASLVAPRRVPRALADLHGKPVPETPADLKSRPVPEAPGDLQGKPVK